jgi:hypothetical protein
MGRSGSPPCDHQLRFGPIRLRRQTAAEGIEGSNVTGNPDGLRSVAKYSKLPIQRIKYFPDAGEEVVKAIRRGILFQMAFWSGPAVQAFAKLTQVIARHDPKGEIELVVVDIDGSAGLSTVSEFFGGAQGAGETAWVRNGSIIATSGRGLNVECFVPNTLLLLEWA